MARKEAELAVRGNVRFMNQELAGIFPNRSLEAIKKARQKSNYRDAVRDFIDELEAGPSSAIPSSAGSAATQHPTDPTPAAPSHPLESHPPSRDSNILEYMRSLPQPPTSYNSSTLLQIIEQANALGKSSTLSRLSSYLISIFPISNQRTVQRRQLPPRQPRNNRQRRRQEYALTQRNWSKHQGRCIKSILEGPNQSTMPPQEVMIPYWKAVMEQSCTSTPPNENLHQPLDSIWNPVTIEDVKRSKLSISTSPGPDGITSRQLRAIPLNILARILNLLLWCGEIPEQLRQASTIFIPKKDNSTDPGDFRPITIPSVVIRQLHSILADRLRTYISLDPRQRAFQPTDGCADNTTLIDLLLRDHHQRYASCYIASLDVSKAFDSVSHNAIFGTLESYGLPPEFIKYLKHLYGSSVTWLKGDGWTCDVRPKRGVKQGDPLSPIIFNLVIDRLLMSLPKEIGCHIGSAKINAVAFADDLLLFASTPHGLQTLIDEAQTFLGNCGMSLNPAKCMTISIKGQPKQRVTVIEQRHFKVSGNTIPALRRSDQWTYLGVSFTPDGRCKYRPQEDLLPRLDRLSKAPLKPQQRLHALRTVVIPQLYHKLTLGNTMIGCLNKTDKIIRTTVRKWTDLPKDVPKAFFHAPVGDGGLGIPSLRWIGPMTRKYRLTNLKLPSLEEIVAADTFIATEIDKVNRRLLIDGRSLNTYEDISNYWSAKLHASVDGFGLREAASHKQAHRWVREPSRLLTGRDYVNCIKLRINALPSRSRTTRGRPEHDRSCRAGCREPETTNHIVQRCRRTDACRIDRHNSVVNYIERNLNNKGYTSIKECRLRTSQGIRKPDLIATSDNKAIVIDAQVVTDGRSLDEAHRRKLNYYDTSEIRQIIRDRFQVNDIIFATATLNWRGIWSGSSVNQLISENVIRNYETALISTRVAIGTIRSFRVFNTTTSVTYRRGVG